MTVVEVYKCNGCGIILDTISNDTLIHGHNWTIWHGNEHYCPKCAKKKEREEKAKHEAEIAKWNKEHGR